MSDNIQENDMEGILSSIKDILEEDEKQQQANMVPVDSEADNILDEVLDSTEIDDVLELSPDMRVDNTIDDALIDVNDLLVNDNSFVNADITNEIPTADYVENIQVSDAEIYTENAFSDENILTPNEPFFETSAVEENTLMSEPFFETGDNISVDSLLDNDSVVEQTPDVFGEIGNVKSDISIDELWDNNVEEPAPIFEEPVSYEEPAPIFEESVAYEEPAPIFEEPVAYEEPAVIEETAVYDPVIEIEPVVEDVVEEEKQDVSSNIMSSFAKMFSHENNNEVKQVTLAGDTSKTLEDLVVDAIQKAIGKEISAKWNNGVDFNGFVEAEIRRQVETWIANNMDNVIESIVKKEVERVIAKVSS